MGRSCLSNLSVGFGWVGLDGWGGLSAFRDRFGQLGLTKFGLDCWIGWGCWRMGNGGVYGIDFGVGVDSA